MPPPPIQIAWTVAAYARRAARVAAGQGADGTAPIALAQAGGGRLTDEPLAALDAVRGRSPARFVAAARAGS